MRLIEIIALTSLCWLMVFGLFHTFILPAIKLLTNCLL
jgi:hypothetical protein